MLQSQRKKYLKCLNSKTSQTLPSLFFFSLFFSFSFRVTSTTNLYPRFPLKTRDHLRSLSPSVSLSITRKLKILHWKRETETKRARKRKRPFQFTTHFVSIIIAIDLSLISSLFFVAVLQLFPTWLTFLSNTWPAWRWDPNPKSLSSMDNPGPSFPASSSYLLPLCIFVFPFTLWL